MLSRCLILVASTLLALAREQPETTAPLSLDALRSRIVAHIGEEQFRAAQWGIKIVALDSGSLIFETNSAKLLKPASNAKLFTGALALDSLGPDYKIRTSLYSAARPENGMLKGNLIIYGRGDPSFSSAFNSGKGSDPLVKIVAAIKQAGIQRIEGDLVGDATFFSGAPYGSSWTWDDLQYYYGAEASALSAQENAIDLQIYPAENAGAPCRIESKPAVPLLELVNCTTTTAAKSKSSVNIDRPLGETRVYITGALPKGAPVWKDSVSVRNAPLWFVTLLSNELVRAGVALDGKLRAVAWPEPSATNRLNLTEIAAVESADISAVVHKMMKTSNNLYAQLLLLQVGARNSDDPHSTTEDQGIKQLNEFVKRARISADEVHLDDGAGLSRSGLVTPSALVQLLRYMARHKSADIFRASLPEAGADGTLRTRLKDLQGKLQAKTGTIRYVNTLAGYLKTASGQEVAFAIMLNGYAPQIGSSARDEIDAIPRLVSRLQQTVN